MRSIREDLRSLGVSLEGKYILYTTKNKDRTVLVPYRHIQSIELRDKKVSILTGSMEKLVIELPSEVMAKQLFDELMLQLEKVYL